MIEYIGEKVFGGTLYGESNAPPGPGRREWIIEGLRSKGIEVVVTLLPTFGEYDPSQPLLELTEKLKYVDDPLVAICLPNCDIFDYRADYSAIREKEFGKDKIYHILKAAEIQASRDAKIVVVHDENLVEFVKKYNDNVVFIPTGPTLTNDFIAVVEKL